MASNKLSTNLVGQKIHIITDDEAKEEARRQGLSKEVVDITTAETWLPGVKSFPIKQGEIVAVHIDSKDELVFTANFGGELRKVHPAIFRMGVEMIQYPAVYKDTRGEFAATFCELGHRVAIGDLDAEGTCCNTTQCTCNNDYEPFQQATLEESWNFWTEMARLADVAQADLERKRQ